MPETKNLAAAFDTIRTHWDPHLLAEVNDTQVRVSKLKGEFVWHAHEHEDEFFLVIKGELTIHLRDRTIVLGEGDSVVIPRGVEHKPEAREEAHVLLVEPASVVSAGDTDDPRSVTKPRPLPNK